MSISNLMISKDLGQDLKVNDIQCNTLEATTVSFDQLSANKLTITSIQGIATRGADLNIQTDPLSAYSINLTTTNGAINIGAGTTVLINELVPVVFQNPYTSISQSSSFNVYSTGTFSASFSGTCVSSQSFTISYTRIGNMVILQFPDMTFIKNNGAASQITSGPIPVDLRPSIIGSGSFYMQLTSLQDQPLTDLCFGIVEYDSSISGIRLTKNDNFTSFSQAASPNNVQMSACSLTYII